MRKTNIISYPFFLFLLISLYVLSSCSKTVEVTHPELIGFWQGHLNEKAYSIRIDPDGSGRYSSTGDGQMENYQGRVRVKNDQLIIGGKRLTINLFPFSENDGFIRMKVASILFQKIN